MWGDLFIRHEQGNCKGIYPRLDTSTMKEKYCLLMSKKEVAFKQEHI